MTTANVLVQLPSSSPVVSSGATKAQPHVTLQGDNGIKLTMPYAPLSMTIDNLTPNWAQVQRSGRKPILAVADIQLATCSFTMTIAVKGPHGEQVSVEGHISDIRRLAASQARIRLAYGSLVNMYTWRLTNATINVNQRAPYTNYITVADVDITLTEASDYSPQIGPVTGGSQPTIPPRKGTTTSTYTVKIGDTLYGIAYYMLGNGNRWPEIASLNNIRDARLGQPPFTLGRVLKIPAR